MLTRMHPVTRTFGMIKSEFKNIKFALRLSFYDLDRSPISRNCDSCVRRKNGKKIWHFTTVLRQTKTWLNRLCKSFTQNAFLSTAIFSIGTGSFDEKVLATMSSTERQRQVRLLTLYYCVTRSEHDFTTKTMLFQITFPSAQLASLKNFPLFIIICLSLVVRFFCSRSNQ